MSFAFVPFYVHFLGVEAYGLIGFFTSILAIFFILDMGLSTTVNRELARIEGAGQSVSEARTLVRTLETIYWIVGVVICLLMVGGASWIAHHWLNVRSLPLDQATRAIQLMGVTAMLRWPVSLYSGALMGMRKHVRLNLITAFGSALQGGGAVLALWLVQPTVVVFFTWQIVAAAVQIVLLFGASWHQLALPGDSPRFRGRVLVGILRFSAGVTGITLLSVVLSQLDKLILSKMLPLEDFGYYSLAATIAAVLTTASGAIYGGLFPAFAHQYAAGRIEELTALYHKSCQLISVLMLPAGMGLAFFAPELLTMYLHNPVVVAKMHLLLSLFAIGNTILSLIMLPLALQLAAGWTKLTLRTNIAQVLVYAPLVYFLTLTYGGVGAASAWIAVNAAYLLVYIQLMHRRMLLAEKWRWYLVDVGTPALVSFVILGIGRLVLPEGPVWLTFGVISLSVGLAVLASALVLPDIRVWLWSFVARTRDTLFKRASVG
jgi:O-antigen/teichoic acid export membrane protein